MSEQRSESSAARMADGAGMTPTHLPAFDSDPKTDAGAEEKAWPLSEAKSIFGAPSTGRGTITPVDGTTRPQDIEPNALNTSVFTYLNEDTGIVWTYSPTNDVWHAEGYQTLPVTGNNVEEFATGTFLTGFDRSHIRRVELEQIAGNEELSIARWDRLVSGTLTIKFRGQQLLAGNHNVIIYYKK